MKDQGMNGKKIPDAGGKDTRNPDRHRESCPLSIEYPNPSSSMALRYGFPLAAVAGASLIRLLLDPLLDDTAQFVTFFAAIVLTGAVGGRNPAIIATILSAISVFFFFDLPQPDFETRLPADLTAIGIFFLTGLFISWIAGRLFAARELAVRELTERRHTEHRLRAARDEWKRTFDSVPDLIAVLDRNHRIVRVNRAMAQRLGSRPEDCVGRSCHECVHGLSKPPDYCPHKLLLSDGMEHTREVHEERLGGDFLVSVAPLVDENGQSVGAVHIAHDITERKRTEESLRASEIRFRSIFENAAVGMTLIDPQGQWLLVNDTFCRMLGYDREDLLKTDFKSLTHPDDQTEDQNRYQRLMNDEVKGYILEKRYVRKDGRIIWVLINRAMVRDLAGKPAYSVSIVTDITERKRTEELLKRFTEELQKGVEERTMELKKANEELTRSNRDLEQFAYVSSHDLQEPLRMVASFVGLLEQQYKGKLDKTADEYIAFAVEGAKRMQRLILDLLEFSRVRTEGKSFTRVEGEKVLAQAMQNLRLRIEEIGARITHEVLPEVYGDESQLVQVFQNLIGNALKFRKPDTVPEVHITIHPDNASHQWVFKVRDNGIGIDPDYHEKVFVIFKRLHNRTQYEGTGIGLAVVKRIVERHGGRVWVESSPGKGSVFNFTLPMEEQNPHET